MVTLVCAIIAYISYVQYPQWLVYLFGMRAGAPVISIPLYCWRMALAPYIDPYLAALQTSANGFQSVIDAALGGKDGSTVAMFLIIGLIASIFVYRDAKGLKKQDAGQKSYAPILWALFVIIFSYIGALIYFSWRAFLFPFKVARLRLLAQENHPMQSSFQER